MKREQYWNNFARTGDIEAYMAYRNGEFMDRPRTGSGVIYGDQGFGVTGPEKTPGKDL